jgi:hypothetical protein
MSSVKARRWTLRRPRDYKTTEVETAEGTHLKPDETVEVAEVSALRVEWEEELLSDLAKKAAAGAYWRLATAVGNEQRAKEAIEAALAAIKEERDDA